LLQTRILEIIKYNTTSIKIYHKYIYNIAYYLPTKKMVKNGKLMPGVIYL